MRYDLFGGIYSPYKGQKFGSNLYPTFISIRFINPLWKQKSSIVLGYVIVTHHDQVDPSKN